MPKSLAETRVKESYLEWSRDPAVGLFVVAPLWGTYELLRWFLSPNERNGAEAVMSQTLRWLGPLFPLLPSFVFVLTMVIAAWSIRTRRVPWVRVGLVSMLEGSVYGLMLGPLAKALASYSYRALALAPATRQLVRDLVASLGAGIFEEMFFRLLLLTLLAFLLGRV